MKISELVKRTGVPKETIHFYIREGLLRKPRKSGVNTADYNENYVNQILLIKDLRDNYYLPIPEIKKVIKDFKKQSPSNQAISQFHSKYFRPTDRLLTNEIRGRESFKEETGLGQKWLIKAIEWGMITPKIQNGKEVFSNDDVAIGKLMVDMERIGFGPKHGHDPEDLRYISDFVREYLVNAFKKYYQNNLEKLTSADSAQKSSQFHELISLLFYHLYRKFARETAQRLLDAEKMECSSQSIKAKADVSGGQNE
jgi:DNA-binding transcriptional MerR regulator